MSATSSIGLSQGLRPFAGALVAAALVVAAQGSARAEDCGNVDAAGICQDPKTLVFCSKGELETIACAAGEICVPHEFFDGSSGCVPTRYTGCGDISEAGRCVGAQVVLYCDNDRVAERTCDTDWTCGLVPAMGAGESAYYDCVPTSGGPTAPSEDGGEVDNPGDGDTDAGTVEPDPSFTPDTIAAPSVEKGGAGAAGEYQAGGGAACASGGSGLGLGLLAALGLLACRAGLRASRRRTARSR